MLKKLKPTTPGQRGVRLAVDRTLWKGKPEKSLLRRNVTKAGRDSAGHISVRHRSGTSYKRMYRLIDFRRLNEDAIATVLRIEYDPNRSSHIALIEYQDGTKSYIIAPEGVKTGAQVGSYSGKVPLQAGNCGELQNIPVGTTVHCIEMLHKQGGKLARSAGAYAKFLGINRGNAILRLKSGEVRMVTANCRAVIGTVSNKDHSNRSLGKAGRNRWLGFRPSVRGTAMNPVDHPHGGGNGKTKGRHPVSPTGFPTKGAITRRNKRGAALIITNKRKAKRRR